MVDFDKFFAENQDKIYAIAKSNAIYDSANRVCISKDDPWLQETEWDDLYNKLKEKYN